MFTTGSVSVAGRVHPFRLLQPLASLQNGPLPLVVFLHGAGERGSDNQAQLAWLPEVLKKPRQRERFPCYLLAAQCGKDEQWVDAPWSAALSKPLAGEMSVALQAVLLAMAQVQQDHAVDPARVYLTGLSMGGYGAFDLAVREPERFAGLLAVCGGGDERQAHRLLGMPVAVWHGADDGVVPVARSRSMVTALHALGAEVDYHELRGVGHDAWRHAYGDGGALPWLFAQDLRQQRRGAFAGQALIPAADAEEPGKGRFQFTAGARCVFGNGGKPAAELLAAELTAMLGATVPVVEVPPERGDVVLLLNDYLKEWITVSVGETIEVRGRDEQALRRAAAMVWQLLHTQRGAACARGRLLVAGPGAVGRIDLAVGGDAWSAAALQRLLREAWCYGASELVGDGFDRLDWLDDATRLAVRAAAARFGVRLLGRPAQELEQGLVFDVRPADTTAAGSGRSDLAGMLTSGPSATGSAARPFVVRMPVLPPDAAIELLRTRLPAIAERAARPTARLHVGAFLSRLGCLLRT